MPQAVIRYTTDGTLPTREVFRALRHDNWLHRIAGAAHAAAETIRREIRGAFYPDTEEWKRKAWAAAEETVAAALAALG